VVGLRRRGYFPGAQRKKKEKIVSTLLKKRIKNLTSVIGGLQMISENLDTTFFEVNGFA
jgi:hypothetical protein